MYREVRKEYGQNMVSAQWHIWNVTDWTHSVTFLSFSFIDISLRPLFVIKKYQIKYFDVCECG